jgi:hypothetical protein
MPATTDCPDPASPIRSTIRSVTVAGRASFHRQAAI